MAIAELKGKTVNAQLWLPIEELEDGARKQIQNAASLPWAFHVAVMPDAHFGKGATVGSVIALKDAVSPSAVGVDIGCGMCAVKTSLQAKHLPDNLSALRSDIEAKVPVGFAAHSSNRAFPASLQSGESSRAMQKLFRGFPDLDRGVGKLEQRMRTQLGSLGGGNHFVELCLDDSDRVWIMLHSGSRHIGKTLADIHISRARGLAHNANLPDPDLAVFLSGTKEMEAYRRDLNWAQEYARLNRLVMLEIIKDVLLEWFSSARFDDPIQCHHNYVAEETHFGQRVFVTRKGAISARKDELGIIPGSMGARSFIVRGLGNVTSLTSASHGAGRRMSRNQAKKRFTNKDLEEQTQGVECRKDKGVIDEIPGAYKNIQTVIDRQRDLVTVEARLKQVLCIKG